MTTFTNEMVYSKKHKFIRKKRAGIFKYISPLEIMMKKEENIPVDIMIDIKQQQFQPMIKLDRFMREAESPGIYK